MFRLEWAQWILRGFWKPRSVVIDETLMEAAGVRALPTSIGKREVRTNQFSYELAFKRLIRRIGESRLVHRPCSCLYLRMSEPCAVEQDLERQEDVPLSLRTSCQSTSPSPSHEEFD